MSWDHSGIFIIHCNKGSEIITELINSSLYMISLFVWRIRGKQIIKLFHTRTKSAALINIKCYQNLIFRLDFHCHLFIRKKQIFFESPVKECTDFSNLCHTQNSKPSKSDLWLICRCDHPVFGILVQKHFKFIPGLCILRNLFCRKKHTFLHILLFREINSKLHFLYNCKFLILS